jgi:hypothetical protein
MGFLDRAGESIAHAWNAFRAKDETTRDSYQPTGPSISAGSGSARPDRTRLSYGTDKSMIASIYTRIAIDVAATPIRHVMVDGNDNFLSTRKSLLNDCLTVEANIDQAATQFRQDIALTLCDEGVIAICPIDTTTDPEFSGFDVRTMRVGRIVEWKSEHVKVNVWNHEKQLRDELWFDKKAVGIVENPLYPIMNSRNSTLQRLVHKLNILDAIDEQSSSGKLDLIIQMPYTVKSQTRKDYAEDRRRTLENQMKDSKYGIGYIGIEEKITQLNRPAENNMMAQIEYLTNMLFAQLGLTQAVFDGTADEQQMLNYHNRTIAPILVAVVEAMIRSFLTKTARSQGQSIKFFRDPFKYVPLSSFPELADKLTRNEIATRNEMRAIIGWAPSSDPKADKLLNSNIPAPVPGADPSAPAAPVDASAAEGVVDEFLTNMESSFDKILAEVGTGESDAPAE